MKNLNIFNRTLITTLLVLFSLLTNGQVAINTTGVQANSSAMLDVSSTEKGLLIPRMTQEQREAIPSPTTGLLVYQTDNTAGFYFYGSSSWIRLDNEGSNWGLQGNEGTSTFTDFIGTTDETDLVFRINNNERMRLSKKGQLIFSGNGRSIFIGDGAGQNDDNSLNMNIFIGRWSGHYNTSGNNNAGIGYEALMKNTTGYGNSSLGAYALRLNETGRYNSAIGNNSLYKNTIGYQNTALGASALYSNTSGVSNCAVGSSALLDNVSGNNNTVVGAFSLRNNTSGDKNLALGYSVASNLTTGSNNIIIGSDISALSATGSNTLNIGNLVFANDLDGVDSTLSTGNVGIGVKNPSAKLEVAGQVKITGGSPGSKKILQSDANGLASWVELTMVHDKLYDADSNTLIQVEKNSNEDKIRFDLAGTEYFVFDQGRIAIKNSGSSVFIGDSTGNSDDLTTNLNTFIGSAAGYSNTSGSQNTAVGYKSMHLNVTGQNNTSLGAFSLKNNSGNKNIALGYNAATNITTGSNNIVIGSDIEAASATSNNTLNIGNLLFANNLDGTESSISSGNVGIGIKNPTARLEVAGQVKITGGNPGNDKWLKSDADGKASWETLPVDIDIHDELYDADSNTLIQVEKNTNEDKIRFQTGGTEHYVFDNGRIAIKNTGNSVFLGDEAGLNDDLTENNNTFVGYRAGISNTSGFDNTALGYQSLRYCTGSRNVAIGKNAGYSNTSGWYNILIGYNTQTTSSNSSSQLNIGNIIYGTGIQLTNPKIGIGVTAPAEKLDVRGNFQVKQTSGDVYTNIESSTAGASLYLKAAGSTLAQVKFYDNGSYGGSMGYDNDEDRIFFYHHGNIFVKDGNLLPGSHKGSDLGLNGMAWDDIYYDDLFNQGAAAFTNRDVTTEIVNHPPKAKATGSFDDKTDRGLPELNPKSLPDGLHQNNAILTDELTTYNYKTNYEQQLLINAQGNIIKQQQKTIIKLQQKVLEMETLKQRLDEIEKLISKKQ
jgi:hypothetical protein